MAEPSRLTTVVFIAVVLAVLATFIAALFKVHPGPNRGRARLVLRLVVVLWLAVPAFLARAGVLDRYTPPPPALILFGLLSIGTVILATSTFGAQVARLVPLWALVVYQVFRVPVEWVLHRLYTEGVVPVQMTYAGRNFDIVTGLTALALGVWLRGRSVNKSVVVAWNVVGLLLLANIVVIAVLSTPTPLRYFTNDPANLLPSSLPYVWLPSFLVQAALFGHLVTFRALRQPTADQRSAS